jgi:hypothetical protein
MEKKSVLVKNQNVVMRQDTQEALLFNPDDGSLICINQTGIDIWNFCDGNKNEKMILDKIVEEYDVPDRKKAEEDLSKFIGELKSSGFIGWKL